MIWTALGPKMQLCVRLCVCVAICPPLLVLERIARVARIERIERIERIARIALGPKSQPIHDFGYLWGPIYRTSIANLSQIYRKSVEHLSKVYRTFMEWWATLALLWVTLGLICGHFRV